jgi:voltage-gated potassium channel
MNTHPDAFKHAKQFQLFMNNVWRLVLIVRGVLGMLTFLIVANGCAIAYFEGIRIADSLYFAFVTAFTIGYGDVVPVTAGGRIVALLIGLMGLIFTGLIIAIANRALAQTVEEIRKREKAR